MKATSSNQKPSERDVWKARAVLEEKRRILRKAWVRAYGSVEILTKAMLDEVEARIKNLNH